MMLLWTGFIALILLLLALDLGIFHRAAHVVTVKEALKWSVVWVTVGLSFSIPIYFAYENHWFDLGTTVDAIDDTVNDGRAAAGKYLTGYIVEQSLSVDNLFVFLVIFRYFGLTHERQHRVLFWGIIGALLMRGGMIFLGAGLILKYQWILIVFGGFLILTALKMALIKGNDDVSQNIAVRLCKKFFRVTEFYDGQKFFTKRTLKPTYNKNAAGREVMDPAPAASLSATWAITPLFLALILVEITDLVFAVDSIPAIFAITPDPFIVFTSNIFAILGLRALYFCLAALIQKFRFLKPALIMILAFVGVKLLLLSAPPYLDLIGMTKADPIKIDTTASLLVVVGTLLLATVLSVVIPSRK